MSAIHVLFDGPPDAQAGRFVEVENDNGESIKAGEWVDRGNGMWALVIEQPKFRLEDHATLCPHGSIICAPCNFIPESWRPQ